jgi:hypothetical protein
MADGLVVAGGTSLSALVAARADLLGGFSLDQRLEDQGERLADDIQVTGHLSTSSGGCRWIGIGSISSVAPDRPALREWTSSRLGDDRAPTGWKGCLEGPFDRLP